MKLGRYSAQLLLDKTVDLLKHKIDARRVSVELQSPAELPSVLADPNQLRQVFINLINNALDALPEGGTIDILISLEADRSGRQMVVVRFKDNGPGVSEAVQKRIFEPFYTTKKDGAGLGLWISERIMSHHGGQLVLESSAPHETVFAVWIPTG